MLRRKRVVDGGAPRRAPFNATVAGSSSAAACDGVPPAWCAVRAGKTIREAIAPSRLRIPVSVRSAHR